MPDVASRVRAQLAEGTWPDEIVARLVAEGMAAPNARRIVDKIAAENIPRPGQTSPDQPPPSRFANGCGEMVAGALFFSFGSAASLLTYSLARPGQEWILAYGLIGGGLIWIYRGLKAFEPSRGPFPTGAFLAALLLPAVAGYSLYEWRRPLTREEVLARAEAREASEEAAKQQAAEAEQANAKKQGQQIMADHLRLNAGLVAAHERSMDPDPRVRCQAARFYRENKLPDEGGDLQRLLESDPHQDVRLCALDAMLASDKNSRTIIRVLEKLEPYADQRPLVIYGYEQLLSDPTAEVASRAAAGLGRVKGE